MNDDDFDEDENEDVENLTLCDEEFDLVDKLSAGSLGLQVRAVRFPTALLIWWRGLVLLGPWLTLAPSWCVFFCQNLAGKRIVPILMDLTLYQHPQLSTAAFEVLCRSYSQRKVGRGPSPPGMVVGTPWGAFLTPCSPPVCGVVDTTLFFLPSRSPVQCFFDSISRMQLLVDSSSVETYKVLQDEVAQLRVLAENGEIWMQLAKFKDSQDLKTTQQLLNHITALCYRSLFSPPLQCPHPFSRLHSPRSRHALARMEVLPTPQEGCSSALVVPRFFVCGMCVVQRWEAPAVQRRLDPAAVRPVA